MDLENRVDKLDDRVRNLENNSSTINETMKHLSHSIDNFVDKLGVRESADNARFNKLTNIVYVGIGGLIVFQFLLANGLITLGA